MTAGQAGRALVLWAKLSRGQGASWTFHPLLCHMLDVASVAAGMWRAALPGAARRRIAAALGLEDASAGRWVAFLAGLHDLGKASPAFQLQPAGEARGFRDRLREAGLTLPVRMASAAHGAVTASQLGEILTGDFDVGRPVARAMAAAVGGHHGTFPTGQEIVGAAGSAAVGDVTWTVARRVLAGDLAQALALAGPSPQALDTPTAMFLAGFVSVADWIGSAEAYFPHAVQDPSKRVTLEPSAYHAEAESRASDALERLGLAPWPVPAGARAFADLFPTIPAPNGLQETVITIADAIRGPALLLVEAPMGEGKTEAAMYAADRWEVSAGRRGMYFALPTQATSNQMFGRVRAFLASRYPGHTVDLQLLHGHAGLSSEFVALRRHADLLLEPSGIYGERDQSGSANVVAAEWFTHRKRGLLGPFGVGTVDQTLLAVLQSRHVFVRLFGLAHKTVIIDEVHAYDTYMTTLLERLLNWLASLDCSVVLLSATLPRSRRAALLDAYARGLGQHRAPPDSVAYPRVTSVTASDTGSRNVRSSETAAKSVSIERVDGRLPCPSSGAFPLGARLQAALSDGGCAAVVCNTVPRAQAVYQALKPCFPLSADDGAPETDLLHARFPFEERERRELLTLARFGKPGGVITTPSGESRAVRRPRRAVLVATQIIEQSLDLDFDLLVTDLAPADLVLQRIGRLHRHRRSRPAALAHPLVWLVRPDEAPDGTLDFGRGTEAVYDGHVLLRSWLALRGVERIRIPEDVEALVEAVYDDRSCPGDAPERVRLRWEETLRRSREEKDAAEAEAQTRWLKPPWYRGSLSALTVDPREEDAPEFHQAHQALTRLSEPTVPIVCLYGGPHGWSIDPQGRETVDSNAVPTGDVAMRLLRCSLSVSDRRVVRLLLGLAVPAGWRRSALLRHHRPVLFDAAGWSQVLGRYRLRLDPELGLTATSVQEGGERG